MADDPGSSMFEAWDGDSQPSEDAGVAAESTTQSEGIPSASESITTESSSITKALDSASINANGPGREHHGKMSRRDLLADEIERLSKEKLNDVMKDKEPDHWKREIQVRMEREIDQRVRDALETPPLERMQRNKQKAKMRKLQQDKHGEKQDKNRSISLDECNSYAQILPSLRNQQPWNKVDSSFRYYETDQSEPGIGPHDRDSSSRAGSSGVRQSRAPGAWGDGTAMKQSTTSTEINRSYIPGQDKSDDESDELKRISEIRRKTFHRYTAEGFKEALRQGKLKLKKLGNGRFMDKNGVVLTLDGPFWPPECGPLYGKPEHVYQQKPGKEPLSDAVPHDGRTVHTQRTNKWYRPWEQIQVVYDSERTTKGTVPHPVPEGCSPSLLFESRFESGNLRQAKRVGQFEYDLVLRTDLYTNRHTQWYYFRVQRMIPGVTYKFNIVNLLKKDSLYNHGMRPLMYSEKEAEVSSASWMRSGHHISYTRNYGFNRNSLLHPEMIYYVLEWQMEFTHENDTCYLAHCYPYTFTDLRDHLDTLMSESERRGCMRREVLCETRAGNSCFLLTVSNFSEKSNDDEKKAVVVTARVHPGETNASWMMKGLLDFITSSDPIAKQLRDLFIFKIIPMLNPDGVIVGNYRCSLSARDLNRNYRHPKKESFPTVWHLKSMLQELLDDEREVVVYCDLHGHSRKHNVFIYGCDPQSKEGDAASFLYQRLFPWLMSRMAPDKFSFRGCKFRVKRCKEATGRVVMWRQMNIANSFTMEATFCGTKNMESIDMPRHFNTSDFQDLGRHFCEALLEYHKAQQNKSLHSELILELTREITHQVLQSRGFLPIDYHDSGQGKETMNEWVGLNGLESESSEEGRLKRRQNYHRQHQPRQTKTAPIKEKTQVTKLPAIQPKSVYSSYFKTKKGKAKSAKGKKRTKKTKRRRKRKSEESMESSSESLSGGSKEEEEEEEKEVIEDDEGKEYAISEIQTMDEPIVSFESASKNEGMKKKKRRHKKTAKEAIESLLSSSSSLVDLLDATALGGREDKIQKKEKNKDDSDHDFNQMGKNNHIEDILNVVLEISKTDSLTKGDHTQSKTSSSKDKHSGTSAHEGVRKIQSRLEALKMIDAMSSETIKGCIHILQDLKILREFVESDTSDSDSASESEQPDNGDPEDETKQNKKRKKKRSKHKSRGVILPELTLPDAEELNAGNKKAKSGSSILSAVDSKQHMKLVLQSQEVHRSTTAGDQPRTQLPLELRFHNPISHLNPDLRPFRMACHAKSHRVFDERALKGEDGPTMYRLLEPQVMNLAETNQFNMNQDTTSASGKFTHMKKYPPFVNRYINRSNNGIPMFSQERSAERNLKRLSTIHKIQKEERQVAASEFNESAEYSRLLAITKQIQEQEAEVRYKMTSSPTGHQHTTGQPSSPFKHPFTHSNSFHGLQQSSQSPHHLQPMDPMNAGNPIHKLQRSNTMIQPSRQLGVLKHPADHRGFLGNHYHGNELTNPITDGNNNSLHSTDALLTDELSRNLQMHCGNESDSVPSGFEKRPPLQLNMKQRTSNNTKLSRPSLSAALPNNPSYNSTNPSYNSTAYKGSTLRHKTAPVGKMTAGTSVNRGHAADLISQQYGHFLSQTSKVPPSAAARYLESLSKSLSKNSSSSSPRPMLTMTKTSNDKEITDGKKLGDLQAKTAV
ncbi:uncharacterized protein [Amphiura filiformis]|uniref:uncharacterized protein n=1 Tax=Amphiura filiformis TaxID=82378 RepID=UPI003B2115E6